MASASSAPYNEKDEIYYMGEIYVVNCDYLGLDYYYVYSAERFLFKMKKGTEIMRELRYALQKILHPVDIFSPGTSLWNERKTLANLGMLMIQKHGHTAQADPGIGTPGVLRYEFTKPFRHGDFKSQVQMQISGQLKEEDEPVLVQHEMHLDAVEITFNLPSNPTKVFGFIFDIEGEVTHPCEGFMKEEEATKWLQEHDNYFEKNPHQIKSAGPHPNELLDHAAVIETMEALSQHINFLMR